MTTDRTVPIHHPPWIASGVSSSPPVTASVILVADTLPATTATFLLALAADPIVGDTFTVDEMMAGPTVLEIVAATRFELPNEGQHDRPKWLIYAKKQE